MKKYLAILLAFHVQYAHGVVFVTDSSNSLPILEVGYDVNGVAVLDTSSSTTNDYSTTPVNLTSVEISLGGGASLNLTEFNTGVVSAVTLNFPANTSGFNIYSGNQSIDTSDIVAFQNALEDVYSNTSLRDYLSKSSGANANNPNGDYDIFYQYSLSNDDYLVVAERDGNSEISLQALDANGNVISGSETLEFTASAYTWDTGYGSQFDSGTNTQTLELSVVDISLFATSVDIFGLRVINDDGADNKIFVASDDTFLNNPVIPEPSTYGLILGAVAFALTLVSSRRRRC